MPPKSIFWGVKYCNNWGCPSRRFCAHHFGGSYEYAAMWRPELNITRRRDPKGKVVCEEFEELPDGAPEFGERRFATANNFGFKLQTPPEPQP